MLTIQAWGFSTSVGISKDHSTYQTRAPRPAIADNMAFPDSKRMTPRLLILREQIRLFVNSPLSMHELTFTSTTNRARFAAVAAKVASQRMTMKASSARMAMMLYPLFRAPSFSVRTT